MKTGLIGNGYWGKIVKSKLELLSDVVFVADSKTDLDSVLINDDVKHIFICTPTTTHYDIVSKCIKYKKNIFCEKPFTAKTTIAVDLFNKAENAGVPVFVDNVFLRRSVFENHLKLHKNDKIRNVVFTWKKMVSVKRDNLYNSWMYHDIYLLVKLTGIKKWNIENRNVDDNNLYVKMFANDITAEFVYDRNDCMVNEKNILINNNIIIDFSIPDNDPLYITIHEFIKKTADFESNKEVTLDTLEILERILK